MRINIYAHLIIIEILDEIYAREQTWSTVEYTGSKIVRRCTFETIFENFL